ncbi:gamma-glutamylcyclotransferase [Roseococcus sp. SDR]|uniref:gamma-glutamylcyclotransferase n=1 Tax=Roseococcus sp. SDR TaxID=2835532 RepID=UPI001BD0B2A0|nr:gamma-glutamylcyclotransferase [Roseococcus sp. SDR]MBS7792446.1 gamma-glutamylcyclotransferase [Roseococcus sp. SDR]MBV1847760.1 gamma-glutamylcyclotransferase [Roseococcus sp. SDR]
MTLYFGYGSNLDARDWNAFCERWGFVGAELVPVSTALMLDCELAFDRYAASRRGGALNLRDRPGQAVEGVVFRANRAALYALDRKEGAPAHYQRLDRHAVLPDGHVLPVMTYAGPSQGYHAPHEDYVGVVRRGQATHGIAHAMMEAVARDGAPPLTIRHLFVYGTLMLGEANAHHLDGIARTPGLVSGRLHDCGAYPALGLEEGEVKGELLELPIERLAGMDALEDAMPGGAPGGMYRRSVLRVRTAAGVIRAYAYVMDDAARFPVIAAGDWRSVGHRQAAWAEYVARGGED